MNPDSLSRLNILLDQVADSDRRLLILLEGSPAWTLDTVKSVLGEQSAPSTLWFSQRVSDVEWVLPPHKLNHELGREAEHVVFDAYSGLHADALAALSGNIRGGGVLWMLGPPLKTWATFQDPLIEKIAVEPWGPQAVRTRFNERMAWLVQQDPCVCRIIEAEEPSIPKLPDLPVQNRFPDELNCLTDCQRKAVDGVLHVMSGHRKRPLVIEADRGRGKSAALGIAIGQLLQRGKRIIVTAPRPEQVETLLQFANTVEANPGHVEFVAPDRLLSSAPSADLLVVDEAAAIAPEMLKALLRQYSRAVFATTVNGYEGTGRGFAIRFQRYLETAYPGWVKLTLEKPIRWQNDDWLENTLNRALLLKPALPVSASEAQGDVTFSEFQYQCDSHSENLLNQIFELLVTAHYRTRPSDLRSMLDGSNVRLFTLCQSDRVIAVAMVAVEGELSVELAQQIVAGTRRPHGQILPQSLAVHLGQVSGLARRHWRIVRIAVQPDRQHQGQGSELLQRLIDAAKIEGIDTVGSLFSGNESVLSFWQHNQFATVRVGYTREATTGDHSLLVVRGLTEWGSSTQQAAAGFFAEDLPLLLKDSHRNLSADLVLRLLHTVQTTVHYYERDQDDLQRYLSQSTPFENVAPGIWRLIWGLYVQDQRWRQVDECGRKLVVMKVLQNHSWERCIDRLALTGIKHARALLRQSILEWTQ